MRHLTIAWRNLNRRPRRAILNCGAIAVIIVAFFTLASLYTSVSLAPRAGVLLALGRQIGYPYFADMMIVGTEGFRPSYFEAGRPILVPPTLSDYAELSARLNAEPSVMAAAPRLGSFLVTASKVVPANGGTEQPQDPTGRLVIALQGIDPVGEQQLRGLGDDVVRGQYLEDGHPGRAIVGLDLANFYNLGVDDRVRVRSNDFEGEFVIGGIFFTNSLDDRSRIFVTLGAAQALTGLPGLASEVALVAKPGRLLEAAQAVGQVTDHDFLFPSVEAVPEVGSVLSVWSAKKTEVANSELLILLGVLGWLFVFQAMMVNVFDRTREIGILKAIGWTEGDVLRSILVEAGLIGLAGGSLGYFAGIAAPSLLDGLGLGPVVLLEATVGEMVGSVGGAMLVCLVGALVPANMASAISPVEAMRRL